MDDPQHSFETPKAGCTHTSKPHPHATLEECIRWSVLDSLCTSSCSIPSLSTGSVKYEKPYLSSILHVVKLSHNIMILGILQEAQSLPCQRSFGSTGLAQLLCLEQSNLLAELKEMRKHLLTMVAE